MTNQATAWLSEAESIVTDTITPTELETGYTPKTPLKSVSDSMSRQASLGGFREDAVAKTIFTTRSHEVSILDVPNIPIELQEPIAGRDVRGLIALLRAGKLVAFLEPSASDLIPRGIEKIRVPSKRVYGSLRSEDLLSEFHGLAVSESVNQSTESANELRLLDVLLASLENEGQWSRVNRRRFHLINKKYAMGLTPEEVDELDTLQRLTEKQMYTAVKIPFTELAMLESYARSLGFHEDS